MQHDGHHGKVSIDGNTLVVTRAAVIARTMASKAWGRDASPCKP